MRGTGRRPRDHARGLGPGGCCSGHCRASDCRHPDAGIRTDTGRISTGMVWLALQFRCHRGYRLRSYGAGDPIRAGRPRGNRRAVSHRWDAGELSDLDRNPALPLLRVHRGRFSRWLSHFRRRRSGGIDRRLRDTSGGLRFLRVAAADGLPGWQFSFESADAKARHRRSDHDRMYRADPSRLDHGHSGVAGRREPLCRDRADDPDLLWQRSDHAERDGRQPRRQRRDGRYGIWSWQLHSDDRCCGCNCYAFARTERQSADARQHHRSCRTIRRDGVRIVDPARPAARAGCGGSLVAVMDAPGTLRAPAGWRPQRAIATYFPAMADLYMALQSDIRPIQARLEHDEALGLDTMCLRQALKELRWRLEYTADVAGVRMNLEKIRGLAALPKLPRATEPDEEGSYGACTEVWFLKLDASVDHLLAADFDGKSPRFLDRVNDPDRLEHYLNSLLVSHLAEEGVDHRKELNFATADLVRLILWRRPANYRWDPRLKAVIRRFVANWQDPATGFFGATYEIGGQRFRTTDLSLTFHMARYLDGRISYWPKLIDTLFEIRDDRYPNGWLDDEGPTSHNNYDVATLFRLGWDQMRRDQRQPAGAELDRLLGWCLKTAVASDGTVVARAKSESLAEGYYFAIAFLDTVGYFDPAKRFWTARAFPEALALRARLETRVRELHQADPMVRMALERLGFA